jgi:hypothetical protein
MKSKNLKIFFSFIFAVILTLGLSISFQSILAAYTAPLNDPPICHSGNPGCDAPLNASANTQPTDGSLWIVNTSNPTYGLIVENGPVGIGTNTTNLTDLVAQLQVTAPSNTEGIRIITSNYSPINIRNTTNTTDIFRVDQTGTLAVGSVPWARLTGFPIACTAGQYVTAVGNSLTCSTPSTSGGDATTLDSLDSTKFLRSDVNNTMSGELTVTGKIYSNVDVCVTNGACLNSLGMGTGTLNYLAKWTLNGKLMGSSIFEDVNGYVGIGTASPRIITGLASVLTIAAATAGDSPAGLELSGSNTGSSDFAAIEFLHRASSLNRAEISAYRDSADDAIGLWFRTKKSGSAVAEAMRINSNGYVGIGTGSTIGYNLTVNGTVAAGVFTYSSDKKLKNNIKTLDNALDKITQLRGVNFTWKNDQENKEQIGLIAQEVEQVYPELVNTANGLKSVEYGNLVAPLIEAIKEQQKQINDLQNQLNKLK